MWQEAIYPGVARPQRPLYLPAPMPTRTAVMDERAIARCLARMASEIVERARNGATLLVGIQRRGVELAERLKRLIDDAESSHVACGKLDITLYRDDLQAIGPRPVVGETSLPDARRQDRRHRGRRALHRPDGARRAR